MKILSASIFFYVELIPKNQLSIFKKTLEEDELQLFEAIIAYNFNTDVEASNTVFNIKSNSIKYQKVKKNLLQKVGDASLFVKPSIKNHFKVYEDFFSLFSVEQLIKVYSLFARRELILPLIEKNFQLSYNFFMHSCTLVMCKNLISYYSSVEPNTKKLEQYSSIYLETINALHQETKADLYYQKINHQFASGKKYNQNKILQEIKSYIIELEPHEGKVRSYLFHRDYYALQMMYYHTQNKYHEVIEVCDKSIAYINQMPFSAPNQLRQAYKRKTDHQIKLGLYDEALKNIDIILQTEVVGGPSWLNTKYLLISTYILQKKYKEADQNIQIVIQNKQFKIVKSIFKRHISLINVYMYLFKLMDIIPSYEEDPKSEIKNYIRDYPLFTKDKSGMNIPIIIAQLVEAIANKKNTEIVDRVEALKKYSSRYITKNESIRSNCFINMMLEVVKQNYHPSAIERHTNKYYTKLMANPKDTTDEVNEIEFIPYEDLWNIIMDYLKPKRKK
jgi:tetratricopeptide (TPR) repeat protein